MNKPKISIIVAISRNRAIGKANRLLFDIPDDLKRFKRITRGHAIVMGQRTFESIGKPLPDRVNIIITDDMNYKAPGAIVVHSIDEAILKAQMHADAMTQMHADDTQIDADTGDADIRRLKTQINADKNFLYEELTYKLRGIFFAVHNALGLGHKESVYQNALSEALNKAEIPFEREKCIEIKFEDKKMGTYRPDFVVDKKILIELKALPFLGQLEKKQLWHYLRGSEYKLALLVNFGAPKVDIKRVVYDSARLHPRASASYLRPSASPEVFICGGGMIYRQFLPLADKLYLTIIDQEVDGDTFFPDWSNDFKKEISREEHTDEKTGVKYSWITLER